MADKRRFGPELTEAEIDALVDNVVDSGVFNKNNHSIRACWI